MKIQLSCMLALLGLVAFVPASQADVYVANDQSVTVYASDAVGNAAPVRTIAGPATGFVHLTSVTVDAVNNELYVADFHGYAIRVFSLSADGNVAPLRNLIHGPNSGISQVRMVAVDTVNDEIFVLSFNDAIRVFPRTASGDVSPLRMISGSNTKLDNPVTLVLDATHNELITNSFDVGTGAPGILVFGSTVNGDVAPLRTISGGNTQMGVSTIHTALDLVNDEIFTQGNDAHVQTFPRTGDGDIAPTRNLIAADTATNHLGGLLIDNVNNRLIVTDTSNHQVRAYARTADGSAAPLLIVGGPGTGLVGPQGPSMDTVGGLTGTGGIAAAVATAVPAMTPWTAGALALALMLLVTVRLRRA